jgi:hypothetical protein
MRKLIFTIILFLDYSFIFGQDVLYKNQIMIGSDFAFYGMGDNIGKGINIEYNFQKNNYMAISFQVYSNSAYSNVDNNYENSSDLGFAIAGRIYPISIKVLDRVYFDIGFLMHDFTNLYGNKNIVTNYNSIYYFNKILYGTIFSIGYDFIKMDRFQVGTRLKMISSYNNGGFLVDGWQLGINSSVYF